MKYILKYWPALLIIIAFLGGRLSSPDNTKEITKKYDQEREILFKAISQKDVQIIKFNEEGQQIRDNMRKDSLHYSIQLQANKRAYADLKKRYNEINLNRANAQLLDSLVRVLYSTN